MNEFEIKILDFIQQSVGCKALDFLMPLVSMLGDYGIVCIALSLILIIIPKTRKMGIQSGLSLIIGLIVCNIILKPLIFRTRPFYINDFNVLVERLADGSFPSGHAISVFEVSTVLIKNDKRFGIPALVCAIAVSFSRLYLYMHYPSDVLFGIILGIIIGLVSVLIVNKAYEKWEDKIKEKFKKKNK